MSDSLCSSMDRQWFRGTGGSQRGAELTCCLLRTCFVQGAGERRANYSHAGVYSLVSVLGTG